MIGFFLQPVVGVLSDRCQSTFGPRRPFIFFLSFLSLAGLIALLIAPEIGEFIQSKINLNLNVNMKKLNEHTKFLLIIYFCLFFLIQLPIIGITIACLGVSILTFSTDSTNNSARALIMDNCSQEDQDSGLSFLSLVSAIGSLFGYLLGAINWDNTFFKILGNDRLIISIISSILVVVCLAITLTSIKETPLVFDDDDDEETNYMLGKIISLKTL